MQPISTAPGTTWHTGAPSVPDAAPAPRKRRWPTVVIPLVVVIVGAGAVGGFFVLRNRGGNDYPAQWDPRVEPIATSVVLLRGLDFKHPVKVNYLGDAEFESKLRASPEELAKERTAIDTASAIFRAAGLVGADVDLGAAQNDTQTADVAAFYSDETHEIYIRTGDGFTVETRVTLAHELTHVLQDQHFNLTKLHTNAAKSKTGSEDALTALIEGDAERVQDRYLAQLSAKDRKAYDRLSSTSSDKAEKRTEHVPAILSTLFEAPYVYGPRVVNVLANAGGNSAIDAALSRPTPSTRIYLDPTSVRNSPPDLPPVPKLTAGEKRVELANDDSGFDNFTFFVMLSARLDAPTALAAADAYESGSEILYSRNGVTCFRAAIDGISEGGNRLIASTLKRWARALPSAAVEATGGPVVFHACDPGKRATAPRDKNLTDAVSLSANRDGLVEGLLQNGKIPDSAAACIARLLMQRPDFRHAVLTDAPVTDALKLETTQAAVACRADARAGLP
jgi:hypothetical protein